jgi:hypothetical protein
MMNTTLPFAFPPFACAPSLPFHTPGVRGSQSMEPLTALSPFDPTKARCDYFGFGPRMVILY